MAPPRAYTRTYSVKPNSNFIWCASYETVSGTAFWRILQVTDATNPANPGGNVLAGPNSASLSATGAGAWNREEVGYGWPEVTFTIPSAWSSGLYAAQFSDSQTNWTNVSVVYFIVRPLTVSRKIILCYPFSTSLAYAGGLAGTHTCLYDSYQPGRTRRVSLDRPIDRWAFGDKRFYTITYPF